jgi:hypothetical protein
VEWIIETGKLAALTFATDCGGIVPTFQNPESRINNQQSPIPNPQSSIINQTAILSHQSPPFLTPSA